MGGGQQAEVKAKNNRVKFFQNPKPSPGCSHLSCSIMLISLVYLAFGKQGKSAERGVLLECRGLG